MCLIPVRRGSSVNLGGSANSEVKPGRSRSQSVSDASTISPDTQSLAIFVRKQAATEPLQSNPEPVPTQPQKSIEIRTYLRRASAEPPPIKPKPRWNASPSVPAQAKRPSNSKQREKYQPPLKYETSLRPFLNEVTPRKTEIVTNSMKTIELREKTNEQLAKLEKINKEAFERLSAFREKRLTKQFERDPNFFKKTSSKREIFAYWLQPEKKELPKKDSISEWLSAESGALSNWSSDADVQPPKIKFSTGTSYAFWASHETPVKPTENTVPKRNEITESLAQAFIPAFDNFGAGNVSAQPEPYKLKDLSTLRILSNFKRFDLGPQILSGKLGGSKKRTVRATVDRSKRLHQENVSPETQVNPKKQRLLAPETRQLLVNVPAVTYLAKPVMTTAAQIQTQHLAPTTRSEKLNPDGPLPDLLEHRRVSQPHVYRVQLKTIAEPLTARIKSAGNSCIENTDESFKSIKPRSVSRLIDFWENQ